MPSPDELRHHWVAPTSRAVFSPLIDLRPAPFSSLSTEAVPHWLAHPDHTAWGASMYLHGQTRRWLRGGGLDVPLDAAALRTDHPRWPTRWPGETEELRPAPEILFLARLLLYLGFYDDALEVLRAADFDRPDDLLWKRHVVAVADRMLDPEAPPTPRPVPQEPQTADEVLPSFLLQLHLGVERIRWTDDPRSGRRALDAAAATASSFERPRDRSMAEARVLRHRATLAQRLGDIDEAVRLVDATIERYDHDPRLADGDDSSRSFLLREGARRAATFGALCARAASRSRDARRLAQLAVRLDPNCASATLLAGELALDDDDPQPAAALFERAAWTGVVERPRALTGLLRSGLATDDEAARVEARDEQTTAGGSSTDGDPDQVGAMADPLPLTVQARREVGGEATGLRELVEASDTYHRFPSFWTLEDAAEGADGTGTSSLPYWARQPANAMRVWQQGEMPWFRAVYFQSTAGTGIREELLHAALGARRRTAAAVFGDSLASLATASDGVAAFVSACSTADVAVEPLASAQLARIAGYLGFADEARSMVPLERLPRRLGPCSAFAAYTDLFLRYLAGADPRYLADAHDVFRRIEPTEETVRVRLVLTIQAGGWCGKQGDTVGARQWRAAGLRLLDEVDRSDAFAVDEAGLLHSRFWRFACFVPFLEGDQDSLHREAARYEELARAHCAGSLHARENMYAALETRARIAQHAGDHGAAIAAFEELTSTIDPADAKAWLNLGDALERAGEHERSVHAFRRSARLGPPYRQISWYRAAHGAEATGDLHEAIRCHHRSLRADPHGLSPLRSIVRLARATGDRLLETWAIDSLRAVLDHCGPIKADTARSVRRSLEELST